MPIMNMSPSGEFDDRHSILWNEDVIMMLNVIGVDGRGDVAVLCPSVDDSCMLNLVLILTLISFSVGRYK